jgi:FG-GAP repeat
VFAATRSRCGGLAALVALLCACATAPAWAAVPGGYAVQRVNAPTVSAGDSFGQRLLAPGDLDSDGVKDIVIASPAAANGEGEVIAVSGDDGAPVWDGVLGPADPNSNASDTATHLGTALAVFSDVSGCAQQPAGANCFSSTLPDGVPELLVSAPGADLNNINAKEIGRVYIVDGASGAIVKRIQLNPADGLPPGGKVEFGAGVLTVADVDNGGKPDIVVGAPGWNDNFDSNLDCETAPASEFGTCLQAGRIFVFFGEAVTGAASSPLNTVGATIANPFAQDDTSAPAGTEPERFGAVLIDTGDVGKCLNPTPTGNANCLGTPPADNSPSDALDGKADFAVTAPRFDQDAAIHDSGTVLVVDGASLKIIRKLDSPSPQSGGHFGEITYNSPSVGDAGGSGVSDLFLAAPGFSGDAAGQGRGYLLDGNVLAPNPVLGTLNDPAPVGGGAFGSAASGVAPGVAVGAPLGARAGTVRIFDRAGGGTLAQTICDPDGQAGAAFGASIATLGDANRDGFDDLAVGAPGFDHPAAANAGRVYLLTSKGPAAAGAPQACVSTGGETTGGGGGGGAGGGDEATPPDDDTDDTVVIARVLRRLVLKSPSKRVRKNATIRLRGTLSASGNRSVCQRRQKIALQRRKASGGRFQTFEVALTRANGAFTARATAVRTYVYRARVSQTARCMGAVSKTAKVSILRKRGSR